jgi:hypothetical protein
MNTTSRGAVIATAMLAGALGLASFVVMSGPAVGHRSQVRPADVAAPSSPAASPTVTPTDSAGRLRRIGPSIFRTASQPEDRRLHRCPPSRSWHTGSGHRG